MIKKILRGAITLIGIAAGYGLYVLFRFIITQAGLIDFANVSTVLMSVIAIAIALIFGLLFFFLTPVFVKKSSQIAKRVEAEVSHISGAEFLAGTAGLVLGLIIASLLSLVFRGIPNDYIRVGLTIVVYIIFIWFGVLIASRRYKDFIGIIVTMRRDGYRKLMKKDTLEGDEPAVSKAVLDKQLVSTGAMPKILDTSVIIDGRIVEIMQAGFLEGTVVIPEFVLVELRHIADSSDDLKRKKGRRGLDILKRIQKDYGIKIHKGSEEKSLDKSDEVDVKLLNLAELMDGVVVTNDYNLNKVAQIKNVKVLNINELANALKPMVLPGEEMSLKLIREGKGQNQGLGYLDDGTMIVVENGAGMIGKTINTVVTSVLQTAAGRMIFARPKD